MKGFEMIDISFKEIKTNKSFYRTQKDDIFFIDSYIDMLVRKAFFTSQLNLKFEAHYFKCLKI